LFPYNTAFHLLLGRVYDDKDVQERIIRNSKLDWVIVRPVILTDGPKTNAYRALVDPRGWTCGFISRADVATMLAIEPLSQSDPANFQLLLFRLAGTHSRVSLFAAPTFCRAKGNVMSCAYCPQESRKNECRRSPR
jgi:hypothetical protein